MKHSMPLAKLFVFLKIFVFEVFINQISHNSFILFIKYTWKKLQRNLSGLDFFGHSYHSYSIKTCFNVALQQSCIPVSVATIQIPVRITSPGIAIVFHARPYGRFLDIRSNLRLQKLHRMNQGSTFLEGSSRKRDNVRSPI